MGQPTGKTKRVTFRRLRDARDLALDAWAKVALGIASSGPYMRATSLVARPWLVALGVARGKAEKLIAQMLSELNMPSRADVLSLSTRLTHIETALDDLSAAVEALRASVARPAAPARRTPGNGRSARPPEGP